jgi:hypothetical protein
MPQVWVVPALIDVKAEPAAVTLEIDERAVKGTPLALAGVINRAGGNRMIEIATRVSFAMVFLAIHVRKRALRARGRKAPNATGIDASADLYEVTRVAPGAKLVSRTVKCPAHGIGFCCNPTVNAQARIHL